MSLHPPRPARVLLDARRPGPAHAAPAVTGAAPLVTVLITAYNRPDELRTTLRALRRQTYPALELFVIDDRSAESLEPVVRAEWPDARFVRNATNVGYIVNRSRGMAEAQGGYILTLDDDSCPVAPDAIAHAVARMEQEPEVGVLAFRVHEGIAPPDLAGPAPREQYTFAFIGCGVLMRADVARALGPYRDEFSYYKEEAEYALRAIDRGARILYVPTLVVHHRVSPIERSVARIMAYSFRNSVWTALLRLPMPLVAVEAPWKVVIGAVEMARQGSVRWFAWGVASMVRGLPRVLRDRAPISDSAAQTYQALRFGQVYTSDELRSVHAPTWREQLHWFRTMWLGRRRPRAAWDRGAGVLGAGAWTTDARPPAKVNARPMTRPTTPPLRDVPHG